MFTDMAFPVEILQHRKVMFLLPILFINSRNLQKLTIPVRHCYHGVKADVAVFEVDAVST